MSTHVVPPIEFDGSDVEITGKAYHHFFRVLRLQVGEDMRIVDGEGRARRGVVARIERAHAVVALGSAAPARESELRLELWVAPPKPDRAAWLVEKATELGAAAVRFVATERTARDERAFGPGQLLRLHRIAIAAVEQCGRAVVPEVSGLHPLEEMMGRDLAGATAVALDVGGSASPPTLGGSRAVVLIGPEGGWSDEERARFERRSIPAWSLGERVLRVETAALAACARLLTGTEGREFR
jgi:16S rRNA (uracil1498-N3)-methyltransferase